MPPQHYFYLLTHITIGDACVEVIQQPIAVLPRPPPLRQTPQGLKGSPVQFLAYAVLMHV
jgi:hypothetical protein